MAQPLADTKSRFEALKARHPNPAGASTEEKKKFVAEALTLMLAANEHGLPGIRLSSEISGYFTDVFPELTAASKLLFEKLSTRITERHESDSAMTASAPPRRR